MVCLSHLPVSLELQSSTSRPYTLFPACCTKATGQQHNVYCYLWTEQSDFRAAAGMAATTRQLNFGPGHAKMQRTLCHTDSLA